MITERLEAKEIAQIYKLWNEYADAINARNTEQIISLWHKDGVQLPPDAPQNAGKEKIQELLQARFNKHHSTFSINPEVVRILGTQAYTYGSFTSSLTMKKGENKITSLRKGKFLTVLWKQVDGSWKILVDCFNYNEPAEQN